jgi:hypothetical protein
MKGFQASQGKKHVVLPVRFSPSPALLSAPASSWLLFIICLQGDLCYCLFKLQSQSYCPGHQWSVPLEASRLTG